MNQDALKHLCEYGVRRPSDTQGEGTLFHFHGGGWFFLSDEDIAPEPASAVLDETRAFRAAEKANTQFGQWMPERWLHLFIKAYGEGQ